MTNKQRKKRKYTSLVKKFQKGALKISVVRVVNLRNEELWHNYYTMKFKGSVLPVAKRIGSKYWREIKFVETVVGCDI